MFSTERLSYSTRAMKDWYTLGSAARRRGCSRLPVRRIAMRNGVGSGGNFDPGAAGNDDAVNLLPTHGISLMPRSGIGKL